MPVSLVAASQSTPSADVHSASDSVSFREPKPTRPLCVPMSWVMPPLSRLESVTDFQSRPSDEVHTAPLLPLLPATTNPGPPAVNVQRWSPDGKSFTSVQD